MPTSSSTSSNAWSSTVAEGHDWDFDAIVVGAGPAGSCAATVLARAGRQVLLLERGPFAGSKNMYGGVVYPRILDGLHPQWWEEAPVQRWVTRRSTMVLTETQALTVDFRTAAWGRPPYNGATAYRPDFDFWLAGKAEAAGATLLCSTTVIGLLRDTEGAVVGVRTDRPDGDVRAPIVIACDGVNSFLAKEAGLHEPMDAAHYTLGVKETLALPKEVIDERFNVRERDGVDIEIIGGTGTVNGGAFVYTNLDTLAVGAVLKLPALAAQQQRPEEIIGHLKAHPAIAPLVEGGEVKEYSAHLIPEAGLSMMPRFSAMACSSPVTPPRSAWLPASGSRASTSPWPAASPQVRRRSKPWPPGTRHATGWRATSDALPRRSCYVITASCDVRRSSCCPTACSICTRSSPRSALERMFRVDNPRPKPGLRRILATERKRLGIRRRDLVRDAIAGWRTFG